MANPGRVLVLVVWLLTAGLEASAASRAERAASAAQYLQAGNIAQARAEWGKLLCEDPEDSVTAREALRLLAEKTGPSADAVFLQKALKQALEPSLDNQPAAGPVTPPLNVWTYRTRAGAGAGADAAEVWVDIVGKVPPGSPVTEIYCGGMPLTLASDHSFLVSLLLKNNTAKLRLRYTSEGGQSASYREDYAIFDWRKFNAAPVPELRATAELDARPNTTSLELGHFQIALQSTLRAGALASLSPYAAWSPRYPLAEGRALSLNLGLSFLRKFESRALFPQFDAALLYAQDWRKLRAQVGPGLLIWLGYGGSAALLRAEVTWLIDIPIGGGLRLDGISFTYGYVLRASSITLLDYGLRFSI